MTKNTKQHAKVAIFMGSASDEALVRPCTEILNQLDIPYFFTITSAHRTPERTADLINELEQNNCQVYICAAGMAAHLAGAVAAKTIKPVIGIPLNASPLNGMDALLATVMMPPGFPVATVALDKAGAKNAAWLAAQILALKDDKLADKIKSTRKEFKQAVEEAASKLK
ncbi:5-(carboxyamino)imidazole ribonucleotide mutase [Desulfovibrio litoralis]|uniref:N5-carboxyaminoimidazole ribonucleotide mutase n=1 Tax=Desulfovibrio litoralis DSM 11393 TaxID=1121455 RepID=A0A1M7SBE0_9BACT|nr:5-(carboxyamino)imidazole ribonucleotide mutase [Desulfovibrio litoralis]SHN55816.1 5-(carboxyamino)imidazole ribonucleotide mutase [Desulfovibrio litoralis DSM 11393]